MRAAIGDVEGVAGERETLGGIEAGVLERSVGEAGIVGAADHVADGAVEPADEHAVMAGVGDEQAT